jgi:hypothetical protein
MLEQPSGLLPETPATAAEMKAEAEALGLPIEAVMASKLRRAAGLELRRQLFSSPSGSRARGAG